MIFSDETTVRLNSVKGLVWNLPGKKKVVRTVKHPIKVNVWGCFSSRGFGRVVCFRQNLDSKFLCDIYKRGLLPTARKQFGADSTFWKLQEDNDTKHTSKLATRWRETKEVQKINWPSMSPDIAPIKNVWQLLKMKLRKKNFKTYEPLVSAIKREWKALPVDLAIRLAIQYETTNFWSCWKSWWFHTTLAIRIDYELLDNKKVPIKSRRFVKLGWGGDLWPLLYNIIFQHMQKNSVTPNS